MFGQAYGTVNESLIVITGSGVSCTQDKKYKGEKDVKQLTGEYWIRLDWILRTCL